MTKRKIAVLFLALLFILSPFTAYSSELPGPGTDVTDPSVNPEDERTDYCENEALALTYTLNEDGTVLVNERWSVYCKGVPGIFTTKIYSYEGLEISALRVFDDEGKGYVRIFGDRDKDMVSDVFTHTESKDKTVTTVDIYHLTTDDHFNINISYTLTGAITNYADAGVFDLTVLDDRLLGEMMPEVRVNLITHRDLEKFSDFKLSIFSDLEHELKPVNKAETDFYMYNVPIGEAVSVKAVLPLELFPKNTLKSEEYILGTQDYTKPDFSYIAPPMWEMFTPSVLFRIDLMTTAENFPGGWFGIMIMLICPVFILGGIDMFGKRNMSSKKAKRPYASDFRKRYLNSYPDDLGYAEAARLAHLSKADHIEKPRYFASVILSLYAKGYVNILATKRNLKITLADISDETSLTDYESLMLIFLEEAMGENNAVTMKELSEYMFYNCDKVHSLISSVKMLLDEELFRNGYLAHVSDNMIYNHLTSRLKKSTVMMYSAVMVIFSAVCNFMFIMGEGKGYLALALVSVSAVVTLALSRTPRKIITQSGEDHATMWDSFARTINESERLMDEEKLFSMDGGNMLFVYANAFGANKRALRHLNNLLPWVGEESASLYLTDTPEGEMYAVNISRLLQFLDDIEKMADNCLKLYNSEKGPFYRIRSARRIKYFTQAQKANETADVLEVSEEILSEEGEEELPED